MANKKRQARSKTFKQPNIAAGMEMDQLKEDATKEEIARGDSTPVTRLVLDRTPDD